MGKKKNKNSVGQQHAQQPKDQTDPNIQAGHQTSQQQQVDPPNFQQRQTGPESPQQRPSRPQNPQNITPGLQNPQQRPPHPQNPQHVPPGFQNPQQRLPHPQIPQQIPQGLQNPHQSGPWNPRQEQMGLWNPQQQQMGPHNPQQQQMGPHFPQQRPMGPHNPQQQQMGPHNPQQRQMGPWNPQQQQMGPHYLQQSQMGLQIPQQHMDPRSSEHQVQEHGLASPQTPHEPKEAVESRSQKPTTTEKEASSKVSKDTEPAKQRKEEPKMEEKLSDLTLTEGGPSSSQGKSKGKRTKGSQASGKEPKPSGSGRKDVKEALDDPSGPVTFKVRRKPIGPKAFGTSGKAIELRVNHFPITFKNVDIVIYNYDVVIKNYKDNENIPKHMKRQIMENMQAQFSKVFRSSPLGYNGDKNAYTTKPSKDLDQLFKVDMSVKDQETKDKDLFYVKLTQVSSCSIGDLMKSVKSDFKGEVDTNALNMVEILLKEYRARTFFPSGRNSFFPRVPPAHLMSNVYGGKIAVRGFFTSIRPVGWKGGTFTVNFDISNAVFFKPQTIIDYIKESAQLRDQDLNHPLDDRTRIRLGKELREVKVRTTHNHHKTKINGLTRTGAHETMFNCDPNRPKEMTSVAKFFADRYNVRLRYPRLNCLHVGSPQKQVYIPIELCQIETPQKVQKKLTPRETQDFIRSTAVEPGLRLKDMHSLFMQNKFQDDPLLKSIEASIDSTPMAVTGRVIDPPNIETKGYMKPRNGSWNFSKFKQGASLANWVVVNYDDRTDPSNFINQLIRVALERGMQAEKPHAVLPGSFHQVDQQFKKLAEKKVSFVMFIVGRNAPKDLYNRVKLITEQTLGIMTQCVKADNVYKANASTIGNLILKINGKLNGVNNTVSPNPQIPLFNEPVMIMGADVNHPPAGGDTRIPSVAAIISSRSLDGTSLLSVDVRQQEHRNEYIQDIMAITKQHLTNFFRTTRRKPNRIIMYRDGVSESQFGHVLDREMVEMRRACDDLEKGYKPSITFICVQKRHHTRLFCVNADRDGVGRMKNIPPGTVVDKDIVHAHHQDFFMASHLGIQGTTRPTRYVVLWDDSDFSMDLLQLLTHLLCHAYFRANKSVSIPCHVYYAHLAAFRGKTHMNIDSDDTSSASGSLILSANARMDSTNPMSLRMYFL